jgi:hypothetical protein
LVRIRKNPMQRQYLLRGPSYKDTVTPVTAEWLNSQQIENHAVARIRTELVAGLDLALLKKAGVLKQGAVLKATGAYAIDDRGTAPNPAAHALPCGIVLLGRGPIADVASSAKLRLFLIEPYTYTNIIPRAANTADLKAKAFKKKDGTGLVGTFSQYCQQIVDFVDYSRRPIIDRSAFRNRFDVLLQNQIKAFEIALNNTEPGRTGNKLIPGEGLELVETPVTTEEEKIEDIRPSLRGQLRAMKEFRPIAFSDMLVDQVEEEFHANKKDD